VEVEEKGELIVAWLKAATIPFDISENIIWLTYPHMMHWPYQAIYNHPLYANLIPQLLDEWKTTLISNFIKPIDVILNHVVNLKQAMQPYDMLLTIHIRTEMIFWWRSIPYDKQKEQIPNLIRKHFACVNFFKSELEKDGKKVRLFLTADLPLAFNMAHDIWNDSVFHVTQKPMHTANVGDHYTQQLYIDKNVDEFYNVMIDWWMIGEGDVMIVSDKSSFSFTAAVRSTKRRFIVGEMTQCVDAMKEGFFEEIYVPTLETWKKTGLMKHYTLQK